MHYLIYHAAGKIARILQISQAFQNLHIFYKIRRPFFIPIKIVEQQHLGKICEIRIFTLPFVFLFNTLQDAIL